MSAEGGMDGRACLGRLHDSGLLKFHLPRPDELTAHPPPAVLTAHERVVSALRAYAAAVRGLATLPPPEDVLVRFLPDLRAQFEKTKTEWDRYAVLMAIAADHVCEAAHEDIAGVRIPVAERREVTERRQGDRRQRGPSHGPRPGRSLDAEVVREIRRLWTDAHGRRGIGAELARRFNLNSGTVSQIIAGRIYRDVV